MTTPILQLDELSPQQASPYVPVNSSFRRLEAVINLSVIARVSSLPTGSPDNVDGDRYILTAADGGGLSGDIAFYAGGWRFCTPQSGWLAFVRAESTRYEYRDDGSPNGWSVFAGGGGGSLPVGGTAGQVLTKQSATDGDAVWLTPFALPGIVTDATTARTFAVGDINQYIRMTSSSANAVTVPPNSTVSIPVGSEIHVRQAGTGVTTLVAGAGVTLNGTLAFSAQHDTKTVKKVATDVWDVIGGL